MQNYWSDIELQPDEIYTHQVGPVTIYLKKVANEIWVAHKHIPIVDNNADDDKELSSNEEVNHKEPKYDWVRWALKEDIRKFSFKPRLYPQPFFR